MDNEPTAALFVGFDFNHTAYAFSQLAFEPPDIRVIGSDDLASFRAGFCWRIHSSASRTE